MRRLYPENRNPHNDEADAFRHALWSYRAAKAFGVDAAKWLGDSHEREEPNEMDERLMDLFNNHVGRQLAIDPRNAARSDIEVIQEAMRNGDLQLEPFRIRKPAHDPFDRPVKDY